MGVVTSLHKLYNLTGGWSNVTHLLNKVTFKQITSNAVSNMSAAVSELHSMCFTYSNSIRHDDNKISDNTTMFMLLAHCKVVNINITPIEFTGHSGDLRSFEIRFKFESAVPIQFDSTVMGRFENFRIGRVCPLLVVVRRLKPLTALSGTVHRLASSMSDHMPVLFNVFEPLRIGMRNL